jgi:predicted nuclease of predicted toxin-antitoxin system
MSGVDVWSVQEQTPGVSDVAVLQMALSLNRWLITFDRDHGELVFSQQIKAPPCIILETAVDRYELRHEF